LVDLFEKSKSLLVALFKKIKRANCFFALFAKSKRANLSPSLFLQGAEERIALSHCGCKAKEQIALSCSFLISKKEEELKRANAQSCICSTVRSHFCNHIFIFRQDLPVPCLMVE